MDKCHASGSIYQLRRTGGRKTSWSEASEIRSEYLTLGNSLRGYCWGVFEVLSLYLRESIISITWLFWQLQTKVRVSLWEWSWSIMDGVWWFSSLDLAWWSLCIASTWLPSWSSCWQISLTQLTQWSLTSLCTKLPWKAGIIGVHNNSKDRRLEPILYALAAMLPSRMMPDTTPIFDESYAS